MIKKSVKQEIDLAIKEVWLQQVCPDYANGLLLREASLQCCLYRHLQNRLEALLMENQLAIYPEFYFPELKFRADLVIAKMDFTSEKYYLSERMTDIAAIIELKYDGGDAAATEDYIKSDMSKLKTYVQKLAYDCQYYFGVVYETECVWLHWFDKRSTNNWANGRLTELNAGLMDGKMFFEVNSYNGMNFQHKQVPCVVHWWH